MQITNNYQSNYQLNQKTNYQPNFRAVRFDAEALELIAKRVPSGKFQSIIDSFKNRFKDSGMNIRIGVVRHKLFNRLDAMIHFNNDEKHIGKDVFFEHIEEGIFKSKFTSPEKFLKKVSKIFKQDAVPFENNGYKFLD